MLLIDPQRAIITRFVPNDVFADPQSTIAFGWYTHPIAKKVSLTGEFMQVPAWNEAACI